MKSALAEGSAVVNVFPNLSDTRGCLSNKEQVGGNDHRLNIRAAGCGIMETMSAAEMKNQ